MAAPNIPTNTAQWGKISLTLQHHGSFGIEQGHLPTTFKENCSEQWWQSGNHGWLCFSFVLDSSTKLNRLWRKKIGCSMYLVKNNRVYFDELSQKLVVPKRISMAMKDWNASFDKKDEVKINPIWFARACLGVIVGDTNCVKWKRVAFFFNRFKKATEYSHSWSSNTVLISWLYFPWCYM